MSKVSKTAGVRVPSTSGGGAARRPAKKSLSARTDGQQALGSLRVLDSALNLLDQAQSVEDDTRVSLEMLVHCAALRQHLAELSMYLRHALAALPDTPENSTGREVVGLVCDTGLHLVRRVAELDKCAEAMATQIYQRSAIGGLQ